MKNMRHCLLMIAVLSCSLVAKAHDFEVDGIYYNITSSTDLTVEVTFQGDGDIKYSGAITIPSTVNHSGETYSVTSIGYNAFSDCSSLTSVTIPKCVTLIDNGAFYGCTGELIVNCNIPLGGDANMGECGPFNCSKFTKVTVGSEVTSIGDWAFFNCTSLASIYFSKDSKLVSIGDYAFSYCGSLASVIIPEGVTSVGDEAFVGCCSLTFLSIPESVISIGSNAFNECTGELIVNCNIPDDSSEKNIFNQSKFTKVTIGKEVTSIGKYAFSGCTTLTSVTIPEDSKLVSIEDYAFSGCSSLTSISIPESVTSIGNGVFAGCSNLTSITLPEGITSIGNYAFSCCSNLTSITLPESVTSIGKYTFEGCMGELIVNCNIPEASTSSDGAFYNSKFSRVAIGNNVISIGSYAFYNCSSLTSIAIPEDSKLISIGSKAFFGCSNLTSSITIPESVTSIGKNVFYGCTGELIVNCNIPDASYNERAFYMNNFSKVTIGANVDSIGDEAFRSSSHLTSVTIAENSMLTSIGAYAFSGCSNLTSFTIPNDSKLMSIGYSAFENCSGLTSITIPKSVTTIDDYAFDGCAGELIVNCNIPDASTTYEGAFYNSEFSKVTIGNDVRLIGNYAFRDCSSLTSITIPQSVTSIGNKAFSNCNSLVEVYCYPINPIEYNHIFDNSIVEVIYVPAVSVDLYMDADGWKEFEILPIIDVSLTVNLPVDISDERFSNMYIEITNSTGEVVCKYLIGEKLSYTFYNLDKKQIYNVYLKNKAGSILGTIQDIHVSEETTVTFDSLLLPQSLRIGICTPDGIDVTAESVVTWYDASGSYLCKGATLDGQVEETEVKYSVKLPKELAMQYMQPEQTTYKVKSSDNNIMVVLEPFASTEITGVVRDSTTNIPISNAMVTFSQLLNGEYAHITRVETDSKGAFKANIYDVPTEVTVAAADYISYTMSLDTLTEIAALGEILMKPISGVVVSTGFTHRTSVAEGETPDILDWYSDYANVKYGILNKTTGLPVSNFSVQYPQIVLLDDVAVGDELLLTVVSRTNSFEPTQTTAVVDSALRCDATFDIVELGGIKASYTTTGNSAVVGILYNEIGEMVQKRSYSSGSLTLDNLRDGSYTLVTMGSSDYFNAIYNLAQLSAVGLVEGADYVKHAVKVESGVVSVVEMESVPAFDESKLYYTGGDTRFTVNKISATAGNYLTLTGKIDFKEEYASKVSDVSMVIDLPESAVFVDNSVMVGAAIAPYTLEGNRLTIPLPNNYTERVRFCIIPTESGSYAPTAFAQFTIDGKEVLQPIGSAHYTIKDLSIEVPSISAKTTIPVSGVAIGQSTIQIYDNDVLIGETTSLANGVWNTTCELHKPYNLSTHRIHAKVTTKLGLELTSETKECMYDMNAVQVSKVTMLHNGCEKVFDFINPTSVSQSYSYNPDMTFTFTLEFSQNDTTKISNVVLCVKTMENEWIPLFPKYEADKCLWFATAKSSELGNSCPVNVSVDFDLISDVSFDTTIMDDYNSELQKAISYPNDSIELMITLHEVLINELEKELINEERVKEINDSIDALSGLSKEELEEIDKEVSILYRIYEEGTWKCPEPSDNPDEEWCDFVDEYIDNLYDFEKDFPDYPNPEDFIEKLVNEEPLPAGVTTFVADDEKLRITYEKVDTSYSLNDYLKQDGLWEVIDDGSLSSVELINNVSKDKIILDVSARVGVPTLTTDGMRGFANRAVDVMTEYNNEVSLGADFISDVDDACEKYAKNEMKRYKIRTRMSTLLYRKGNKQMALAMAKSINLERVNMAQNIGKAIPDVFSGISTFAGGWGIGTDINDGWDNAKDWDALIDRIRELCSESASADIIERAKDYKMHNMYDYIKKIGGGVALTGIGIASATAAELTFGASLLITAASYGIGKGLDYWETCYTRDDNNRKREIRGLVNSNPDCIPIYEENNGNYGEGEYMSPNPDLIPIIDPSGYVYEGVSSNRLEGVTASCYYKETVEDMYGDLHENVVLWDAEEYAQENPLFTDEYGMYRWDVPKGLWQVKFEKEGYETTYSEWLPVPPPQLEVNIPMVQNKQPEVAGVHAYKDGVEIEFDKYMQPATLNTDNIYVIQNGEKVAGKVTLLNEEVAYEGKSETFASKVRFVFDQAITAKEITLTVVNGVKSYAGLQMQDTYTQTFAIEQEVEGIVADSLVSMYYGGEHTLTVKVIPAEAAAGKTLVVASSSSMILAVDTDSITLDSKGEAVVTISGELPGTGVINYSLVGYDYRASTLVEVEYNDMKMTANPTASIASGSTVKKGTEVTLNCTTEGAVIYYTLDGSCPCDEATQIRYDGTPIVIDVNTELRIMAMAEGCYESDVVVYYYYVEGADVEDVVLPFGITPTIVKDGFRVQGIETECTVSVYSTGGELVLQREHVKDNAFINIAHAAEGMYIVVVNKDDETHKQRIMKVK